MSDEKQPEAEAAGPQSAEAAANSAGSADSPPEAPGEHAHAQVLPPATLSLLLTSLGTQALMSMGQIANPLTKLPEVDRDQAQHCIDLLGMLEEKTANNRTAEESQLLDGLLYELRMLFLQSGK